MQKPGSADVVIIGAGIIGIAAAYKLQEAGRFTGPWPARSQPGKETDLNMISINARNPSAHGIHVSRSRI
jgi:thioredoxin reductase